ncbi:MAG TPA: hypothetical protein VF519_10365 [Mycobacteriales bacterium]|jgi:hypothetical protein
MKRTLSLKRETLASLSQDELVAVHGGQAITTPVTQCNAVRTLNLDECVQVGSREPSCIDCITRFC